MKLKDIINEVYARQAELIEKQEADLSAVRLIKVSGDALLRFHLSRAVRDLYAPLFQQCRIEIAILEAAQKKLESADSLVDHDSDKDAEIKRLREALKPFAKCAEVWRGYGDNASVTDWMWCGMPERKHLNIRVLDLRNAAAALEQESTSEAAQ